MAEGDDYSPGVHAEHDFKRSRQTYQTHARQRVEEVKQKPEPLINLLPLSITTDCTWPLLSLADVTGSVGEAWLTPMFAKYPYLFHEGKIYMGKDLRILFGAVGDSHLDRNGGPADKYFAQAIEFVNEFEVKEKIKKLVPEGGGGGQSKEDYQLWVLYALHNIHFPKARRKPLLILNGDEAPWEEVSRELARKVHVDLGADKISTKKIFKLAKEKFTIYMVRKPYDRYEEHDIHVQWVKLLGDSHVCVMKSPDRVVDVYFGIMAKEAGMIPTFKDELSGRQTAAQCKEVMETLESIFADETPDDMPIEAESDKGVKTAPLV
jgi:hypothetical protein